ncbi:MAG: isoprenylcysteine carboxylmethyltransferase family protein [Anaerolineales bacterium]|nr:isoprenylcysteine carboxylmethyltransferase family protein [Anaerolineales bacterium]
MNYIQAIAYTITTILIYLGVPLLGWGLGNLGGYFASLPRSGYAVLVLLLAMAVGWQAYHDPTGIRGGKGAPGKQNPRQHVVRLGVIALLYLMLFFLPFADRRSLLVLPDSPLLRWLGVILTAGGFWFIFWSGVTLGQMYSQEVTIQQDHHLITGGVFHRIRHPRYLSVMLLDLGGALIFRSWAGLLISLPLLAVLMLRIQDEEALMQEEFGQEWTAYCQHTWRLIPHIF